MDIETPRDPLSVDHYARGIELYRQGQYHDAETELAHLLDQSSLVGRVARFYYAMSHRRMGEQALQAGQFDAAEKHFSNTVGTIGRETDLTGYLASIYAITNRPDRCVGEMEKVADSHPQAPTTWRKLAQAQWRAGRRIEAYMTLTQALRRLGGCAELHLQMGLFHAAEDRFAEAKSSFARAVEADCTSADAHYYLALSMAAHGDVTEAVRSFQRAFELRPKDCTIAYQLALAARAAEQDGYHVVIHLPEPVVLPAGSQMRQLAHYVAGEPDFAESFLSLPDSEMDSELFGMLVGVIQMALAEHPKYADLHHLCARAFVRLDRPGAAMEHARHAVEINPRYVQARVLLARLCARMGRPAEAIEHMEKAIDCGGDWPDTHCFVAELLKRCSEHKAAKKHLERALQLNAKYSRAADQLRSLAA